MLVLSLAIIPLLVIPLVADLSPRSDTTFFALDWLLWAAFALEYGIRLYLAPAKGRFMRSNVIDLVVVVVPFLRPLRIMRSARMLRLLRAGRAGAFLFRGIDAVKDVLTRHNLHYTLLVATAVSIGAGIVVAELERGAPHGTINSVPDGLWWAVSTVTTVGYGDTFPTTAAGRAFAVVLMLVGVGLFGLLTASLASFLIQRDESESEERVAYREIIERLDRIEGRLEERERRPPS
jgi:voltage-gated potassium channel